MSRTKLKLMVSVFKHRMEDGETFDEIVESYPKLTEEDIEQIREALNL